MRSSGRAGPERWSVHSVGSLLVLAAAWGPAAARLPAQTVSPPIAEYQERARSSFQLTNGTLYPLNVVLEVRGFEVSEEGQVLDAPLDTNRVQVRLSAMSFRIPPRGTYTVFYEARADSLPAWFNILSAMTGARTDNGLNVRILLPHVVYLNQKQPLSRGDVAVRHIETDSATGRVRIQLENDGPRLGRLLQLELHAGEQRSTPGPGFPLFPHSRRWVEVDWPYSAAPDRVTARFARFTLDTLLTPRTAARR